MSGMIECNNHMSSAVCYHMVAKLDDRDYQLV